MSAIAGILLFDSNKLNSKHLEGMLSSMAYRGPDGCATWSDGFIAMGHLMLHTTKESISERLPLFRDNLVITADARVDNRDELISQFSAQESCPNEISDCELILRSYRRWGEDCPKKIIGDYAFAIWDGEKQQLFCARDHIGVKPFYYHLSQSSFAFGSDPRAILSLPWVPERLNEEMVANFLQPILIDRRITFFEGVYRLPAAHTMKICKGSAKMSKYWSLDPDRELKLSSDREYADAFRKVFFEAVRSRLRSAFPVGSELSGGLDSSSVVCTACRILENEGEKRLATFSAVFPDLSECDERQYIDAVLSHVNANVDPHYVRADLLSPFANFEEILCQQGEPFFIPNMYMSCALFSSARENGVRVLLDGFEGDTVVSHGHMLLVELVRSGRFLDLFREINGACQIRKVPYGKVLWRYCLRPFVPEAVLRMGKHLMGKDRDNLNEVIDLHFAGSQGLIEKIKAVRAFPRPKTLRIDHYESLEDGFIQFVMEAIDRLGAAYSLECRHPFFDRNVMEFCLSLPPEQKLRRGWTRWVMRQAMSGILPPEVQRRPGKTNLGGNFRRGIQTSDKRLLEEVIFTKPGFLQGYVNLKALQEAYTRFESYPCKGNDRHFWAPVTLALWLKGMDQRKSDKQPGKRINIGSKRRLVN
ncbi:MAG: hypothetical protein QG575_53 [Euryarchaeota archaeon]|nr:hypothetical protein [Euryarchaeota archaeon]